MDGPFLEDRIRAFLGSRTATFQEIGAALKEPDDRLALALGIMVKAGTLARQPALYRLKSPPETLTPATGAAP